MSSEITDIQGVPRTDDTSRLPPRAKHSMLVLLMLSGFFCLFNETVLSVGNTAIMKEWGLEYNTVQWTMSAFLVAMSISVPIAAFVIHRFSTVSVYVCSLALIFVGLVLNTFSPSFSWLIMGRVVEGLGAGLLPSLLFSSALKLTKPASQGFVTALCGVIIGLGPSLAPVYAGTILSAGYDWRILFRPLALITLGLLLLGFFFIHDVSERRYHKLDLFSVVESVIGFTALVSGINVLAMNLTAWLGWLLVVGGLIFCVLWGARQLGLSKRGVSDSNIAPVLNLSVMRTSPITAGMGLIVLLQIANMGLAVVYPMAVEPGLNISPFVSSLMLMVPLLISQVFALFAGKLFDRFGATITVVGGLVMLIAGFVLLIFAKVSMGPFIIGIFATLAFAGVAFALPTIQARMFSLVEPEYIPDLVSGAQTSMQVGGALGTTVTMGIFSAAFVGENSTAGQAYLSSFAVVSIVLAVVYTAALGLAFVVVRKN